MKTVCLCLVIVLIGSACSNRGSYENVRHNHLQQCNAMPESARKECIERATGSYDAYEQERKALLEDNKKNESAAKH